MNLPMNDKVTTIQISRSRYVERDRGIAIMRLDDHFFEVGEPVMVRYFVDEKQIEEDTVLAIGIKAGQGPDCYKVLSLGGLELIKDVLYELPDVSSLVHGALYLYQDPSDENGRWYYVYEIGGDRQIEEVTDREKVFVSIENRYRYFWKGGVLKREDDFFTESMLDDIINEVFRIVYPPYITAESISGYLFRAGESVNIKLKIEVLDKSGKDLTSQYVFSVDGETIGLTSEHEWTYYGLTVSHDFQIRAENSMGMELSALETQVQVRFGYDIHYGVEDDSWTPSQASVLSLSNHELHARENIEWSGINLDNQITVFAAPEVYGRITHIHDDNGLDLLLDYNCQIIDIKGVPYYVYWKVEPIQISDFVQKYIYNTEDKTIDDISEGILFEQYSEVVEAWKKQGLPGGLAVIESDGKLDPNILPSYDLSSYVELIGFVSNYPTTGMNPGEKWYNTSTKKIFTATSSSSGQIENPLDKRLYINLRDHTIYIWKNREMVNVTGAILSNPINNLTDIL